NVNASLGEIFRDFMVKTSGRKVEMLQDFTGFGGDKRFFSNRWLIGGAINNYDVEISKDFYFNYDFLDQELHVRRQDTNIIVNTNYVKRFYIINSNQVHHFVKNDELDPRGQLFYEAIGYNPDKPDSLQVELLKLRKVKKLKANKDDYLNNFNGDFSDVYDNDITWFLAFPDKSIKKTKLTRKELIKALPENKKELDAFFTAFKDINESNAENLIRSINK
ncbi:MAG TPA: hypothetical protein VM012_12625, partial [Flavitalea sp.]|nr:hypothetical protein [Flavitalea sp.]